MSKASLRSEPGGKPLPFRTEVKMKRVSFYVPEPLYEDMQRFAQERGDSLTGILRWSLGVGKLVWDEIKRGHSIRSVPPEDSSAPVKEFAVSPY